jgi:release factor glutamine methyltransferase
MTVAHTAPARQWRRLVTDKIAKGVPTPTEAHAMACMLLAHHIGYTTTKEVAGSTLTLPANLQAMFWGEVTQLQEGFPLQYILGATPFLHGEIIVNKHVLIPRKETEELVAHMLHQHPAHRGQVLDLCTGSGCIAIALKDAWPKAAVTAVDISAEALAVAKQNAEAWQVEVNFFQRDILQDSLPAQQWDIMVSNPPYVCYEEQKYMSKTVLEHEPVAAIFVPDHNPLCFYKRILQLATTHLAPQGLLYVEINKAFAAEVARLLMYGQFEAVQVHRDLSNNDRWISAVWPGKVRLSS